MISVLMSAFNEEISDLKESIDSILTQTYNNFEFIIVLDNTNNNNLKEYLLEAEKADGRIKLIFNEKNIGLAQSLNRALAKSTGEYIARMDADDISLPDRFNKQIKYLKEHSDCDVLGTNRIDIDENGLELNSVRINYAPNGRFEKAFLCSNLLTHPSVMMRREAIVSVGGYRNFKAAQDYDLWLRILKNGGTFYILPDILLKYRIRANGISQSNAAKQHGYMLYSRYLFDTEKNGENRFSDEDFVSFLKKNKLFSDSDKNNYNCAYKMIFDGLSDLKHKHFIAGIKKVFKSSCLHKIALKYAFRSLYKDRLLKGYIN